MIMSITGPRETHDYRDLSSECQARPNLILIPPPKPKKLVNGTRFQFSFEVASFGEHLHAHTRFDWLQKHHAADWCIGRIPQHCEAASVISIFF